MVQWCHLAASLCTSCLCLVDVSITCRLHQYLWVYHTLWIYENLFWPFLSVTTISLHGTCRNENGLRGHKITLVKNQNQLNWVDSVFSVHTHPKPLLQLGCWPSLSRASGIPIWLFPNPSPSFQPCFSITRRPKPWKQKTTTKKHYKSAHIGNGRKQSSQIINLLLTLVNLSKLPIDWLCPDLSSRPSLSLFSYRIRTESRASMSPPSVSARDGFKEIELCRDNLQFASLHQSQFENKLELPLS